MPHFHYRAVRGTGELVEGAIEAVDQAAAAALLQASGLFPLDFGAVQPGRPRLRGRHRPGTRRPGTRLSGRELGLLVRELGTLVGAGLTLDRALAIAEGLGAATGPRRVAAELRAGLATGEDFSTLLARHPAFPRLAFVLVAAGEAAGDLGGALERLAATLERARAVRQSVISALVYPVSVLAVGIVSALFLLTFVMPRFAALLSDLGREPPLATAILLGLSGFLADWGLALCAAGLLGGCAIAAALRDPARRLAADRLVMALPLIGGLLARIEAERFARTLAALTGAGVRLPVAVATAGDVAASRVMAHGAAGTLAALERGEGIGAALTASGIEPLVAELARVGEETGAFPAMMEKAADILRQESEAATQRLVGLLTPATTVLLGVLIGALVVGVFEAVLEAYDVGL